MYKSIRREDVKNLTAAEKLEVREVNNRAKNMYGDAWEAYLRRTGQTEEDVQRLVKRANEALKQ